MTTTSAASFDAGSTLAERMRTHAGDRDHLDGPPMRAKTNGWKLRGAISVHRALSSGSCGRIALIVLRWCHRGMDKHLFARPEILIPSLFALWFASAAVYALVFTY